MVLDLAELFKWRDPAVAPDIMSTPSGPVDMPTLRRAALFIENLLYEEAWRSDRAGWKDVQAALCDKQARLTATLSDQLSLTFWGGVALHKTTRSVLVGRFAGISFYLTDSCSSLSSECFCPAWSVPHDEAGANLSHAQTVIGCIFDSSSGSFQRAGGLAQPSYVPFDVTVHCLVAKGRPESRATSAPVALARSFVTDAEREKTERDAARAATKGKSKAKGKAKSAAPQPDKRKPGKDPDSILLASIGPSGAHHAQKANANTPVQPKAKKERKLAEDAWHLLH